MKKDSHVFWKSLRNYFSLYLPKQRNNSTKTIVSCHMAWNLFLKYILRENKVKLNELTFQFFTPDLLAGFLDWMESERKWKASTRNQRLSCIRSFFKYASYDNPTAYSVYAELTTIPLKKGVDKSHIVDHMTKDAMAALLSSIDVTNRKGFRDYFFIALMYDTAARDAEMLGLRLGDLDIAHSTLYLMGKGSKPRIVPVSKDTLILFEKYKPLFHSESNHDTPMFYTMHRGEKTCMSDDNVARFMKTYAVEARKNNPQIPNNVHPHMIRHSRAMHLYQGGMPLSILSEFLGHEDPETTLIYAYADTKMKRDAIEKAATRLELSPFVDDNNKALWKNADIICRLIKGY